MTVTTENVRKMMDEVLAPQGKTVQNLIDKINSYPDLVFSKKDKQAAIAGISGIEQEIANTINNNAGKSPQEIVALIEANPNITGPISQVNAKKGNLDLKNDIKVADIANSGTFNSFVSSPAQDKSNDKPAEKTQTATPASKPEAATPEVNTTQTNPPQNPSAATTTTTTPKSSTVTNQQTEQQRLQQIALEEEAKKKKEQDAATVASQQNKNPLIKLLEGIPGFGPILIAFLGPMLGITNQEQVASNPPVAPSTTTPTTNPNDVALAPATTPAPTPANITPLPTPNPPAKTGVGQKVG